MLSGRPDQPTEAAVRTLISILIERPSLTLSLSLSLSRFLSLSAARREIARCDAVERQKGRVKDRSARRNFGN